MSKSRTKRPRASGSPARPIWGWRRTWHYPFSPRAPGTRLADSDDVEAKDEAAARQRVAGKPHWGLTPDMAYRFVAKAPEHTTSLRPVVIGMGPCGLFAGLVLAQMGFRPIILERGTP